MNTDTTLLLLIGWVKKWRLDITLHLISLLSATMDDFGTSDHKNLFESYYNKYNVVHVKGRIAIIITTTAYIFAISHKLAKSVWDETTAPFLVPFTDCYIILVSKYSICFYVCYGTVKSWITKFSSWR